MSTPTDPFAGMNQEELNYLHALNQAKQATAGLPAQSTGDQLGQDAIAYVQKNVPQLAWMLNVPELATVIQQIVAQGLTDPTQIQNLLETTTWWKTQSADVRNWYQLEDTDPATAQEQVQAAAQNIQATADNLGVRLSQDQINSLAYADAMNGWSDTELQNHIAHGITPNGDGSFSYSPYYIDPGTGKAVDTATGRQAYYAQVPGPNGTTEYVPATPQKPTDMTGWASTTFDGQTVYYRPGATPPPAPGQGGGLGAGQTPTSEPGGTLQATEQQLEATAKSYFVNVDPQTLARWAAQIAAGQQNPQAFQSFMQQQALSKFGDDPGMAQAIKAGSTPLQYVSPYASMLSQELGVDTSGIDWTQPKYAKLLTTTDPSSGQVASNPVWKARQTVRSDPSFNWSASPNGVAAQYDFVQGLEQAMGFRSFGGVSVGAPAAMGNSG